MHHCFQFDVVHVLAVCHGHCARNNVQNVLGPIALLVSDKVVWDAKSFGWEAVWPHSEVYL